LRDWNALRAQKDELVASLRQAKYVDLLPAYENVAYLEGTAHLGNGGVTVDGKSVAAGKIILATGSREFIPTIPGFENTTYLTSTTAFEMTSLPESPLVIGGGYVGCECCPRRLKDSPLRLGESRFARICIGGIVYCVSSSRR